MTMASYWKYLVFIAGAVFLFSCKEKKKENQNTQQNTDSVHIEYVDSVYEIHNEYTQIKTQLCDTIGFQDLKYTNANTQIFSLNPNDSTQKFLFITEVDCAFPAGNCGKTIEVIERAGSKYKSMIKVCGKIDSIYLDKKTLTYSTISNRKYNLDFSGNKVKTNLLSVHNMPVEDLKAISKSLNVIEENLILKGEKTDNLDAIPVVFEKTEIEPNIWVCYYQLAFEGVPYNFVFLHQKEKLKQQIGGKSIISIKNNGTSQIELVEKAENGAKIWKFNRKKKIFSSNT